MSAAAKVPVSCPQCGKQLMVPTTAAGKQGRCPACTHVFVLPALLEEPESDELPQLAPLAPDPFGQHVPSSGYQLQPTAPQNYYAQPSGYANPSQSVYGSPPAQQPFAPQQPVNPYMANAYAQAAEKQQNPDKYNHAFGMEQRGMDAGMMGGLALMVLAAVWFGVALFCFDIIFFYPPILFVIGLVGFVRGLFTGNIAGGGD
jgi:hypothetical protein